jgi:phage terminase small subunit
MRQRQYIFIEHYLLSHNATESAIVAGYSKKTAYSQGARLLKRQDVKQAIEIRQNEIKGTAAIKIEQLICDILKIARFDIRALFNEDGSLKKINELDERTAFAISEYSEVPGPFGVTKRVKLNSKQAAQDMLLKIIGAYANDFTIMQKMDDEQLESLAGRVLKMAKHENK